MEIKYVYVKTRSQFGKQCIFDDSDPCVEENIYPDPEVRKDYIHINPAERGVQVSKQFAAHEVQTESVNTKESGMDHAEGGWPKEINPHDEEAVSRYRRRIEKEDNWAPKMHKLMEPMERYILQNNAINIYEQYFHDLVLPKITSPSVRTVNVYKDLQDMVRPITHLSWSSDNGRQLVGAYCSVEFSNLPNNLSLYSYIWDVENSNKPLIELSASHPSVTIEFNPRDPSLLISGLISGQVCNWDIRSGKTPIMSSHAQFSHKYPANCALWINSKTNSEFFSASIEGTIYWWDMRMLRKPTESLIMDLVNPLQGSVVNAIGVSSLEYETTMGTKFIAGLENGFIVNATRKAKNTAEKIAIRFECHYGPVMAIDRNPFSLKNFLTVGDWSTKIWAEDTREGNLVSTRQHKSILTGGCWSTSRCSVFYVINNEGTMEIFDILLGLKTPVTTTRLCGDSLRAIAPHVNGKLVAVGSDKGKIYLVECSDALTSTSPNDRNHITAFFDQCSRYEKAVDSRQKETRLAQRIVYQDSELSIPSPRAKLRSKNLPRKQDKDRKIDEKRRFEKERKKMRQRKSKDIWALLGDSELADVEQRYFEAIEKEMGKYTDIAAAAQNEILESTASTLSIKEALNKRGKHDDLKVNKDIGKKRDTRKQRILKESTGKDRSERASKAEEIVIVKRKHNTLKQETNDDDKIEDRTEATGQTEITDEKVMMGDKTYQQGNDSDDKGSNVEMFEASMRSSKREGVTMRKKTPKSMGKRTGNGNLCGDEICAPEICCKDQIDSSIHSEDAEETDSSIENHEKRKMTVLIEEMIADSSNNVLPLQLVDLPRFTEQEKVKILRENSSPPMLLRKMLKDGKRGYQQTEVETINRQRLVDFERSSEISPESNDGDGIMNESKVIHEALSLNSITAEKLEPSIETLKLNERHAMSKKLDKKTGSHTEKCEPIVAQFGPQEILGAMGVKMSLSGMSAKKPTAKLNATSMKSKNYPRISAAQLNK